MLSELPATETVREASDPADRLPATQRTVAGEQHEDRLSTGVIHVVFHAELSRWGANNRLSSAWKRMARPSSITNDRACPWRDRQPASCRSTWISLGLGRIGRDRVQGTRCGLSQNDARQAEDETAGRADDGKEPRVRAADLDCRDRVSRLDR
ncbi:hypothetical protein D3C71_1535580 [compost metagenome]